MIYNEGEPDGVTAFVSTMFESPDRQDEAVITGIGPAVIGRDAHPIDVGGTRGWLSTDGAHSVVSWRVVGDTYTSVLAGTPEAAAELARSLRFVPVNEWAQQHGIDLEEIAVDSVLKRNPVASRPAELERLQIAIRENIVTPEVKANGYGGIDPARLNRSIDQIALTYQFKNAKPEAADIFDPSFLPAAKDRAF